MLMSIWISGKKNLYSCKCTWIITFIMYMFYFDEIKTYLLSRATSRVSDLNKNNKKIVRVCLR